MSSFKRAMCIKHPNVALNMGYCYECSKKIEEEAKDKYGHNIAINPFYYPNDEVLIEAGHVIKNYGSFNMVYGECKETTCTYTIFHNHKSKFIDNLDIPESLEGTYLRLKGLIPTHLTDKDLYDYMMYEISKFKKTCGCYTCLKDKKELINE